MKVAVLGAGGMGGTVIEHLRGFEPVTEIVAQDVRAERVAELEQKYGIRATRDLGEVLSDRAVRLVFITASNDAHRELCEKSIAAGKAIMCEKPIATTLGDAKAMVGKAEETKTFLQIGFECRYSKLYMKVREWIEAGLLGDVVNTHGYYICSEFHKKGSWRNKTETGGSMFGEKLSHYVDLPRWWIGGRVEEVMSMCAPNVIPYYEVRDNYHTTYRFDNGAVSHLTFMMAPGATFDGDPLADVIDIQKEDGHYLKFLIVGTKGCAETDVFRRTLKRWEFVDSPECQKSVWVDTQTWDKNEDHFYFHNTTDQARDIVLRVRDGKPPKTPARDALETMRLVFAAEKSADAGRPVRLSEIE